jgi:hypothetical protein
MPVAHRGYARKLELTSICDLSRAEIERILAIMKTTQELLALSANEIAHLEFDKQLSMFLDRILRAGLYVLLFFDAYDSDCSVHHFKCGRQRA